MPSTFENTLRKTMETLGRLVEAMIGKAKQARVQVGTRSGLQPIISLEGQLPSQRIHEITDSIIQKYLKGQFPEIKGDAAEIGESPISYAPFFLANHARMAIGIEIGGKPTNRQGDISKGFIIRADPSRLPLSTASITYLLARLATHLQGDMTKSIREISRILAQGAQGTIIDYHPFGLYAKKGAGRARPAESGINKFEDYYCVCKKAGLRIIDVREAFVDETIRSLFRSEEIATYRNLKGTPFLIFLSIYKPKGLRP